MKIPLITITAIMLLASCQGDSKKETTRGSSETLPAAVESKKSDRGAEAIIAHRVSTQRTPKPCK